MGNLARWLTIPSSSGRLAKGRQARTPRAFINLVPPSFEFHLFDDSVDRFHGNMELTSYRGKGEAVLPANVHSGIAIRLAGLHHFVCGFP
jgi:hypothetical protein